MIEISVSLQWLTSDLRPSRQRYYSCDGPDGKHFTNSNKSELTSVLRRNYGPVKLNITDHR